MRNSYTEEQKLEIDKLRANGMNYAEISKLTKVPKSSISHIINRNRKVRVRRYKRLPRELATRIYELKNSGKSFTEISSELNIPKTTCVGAFRKYKVVSARTKVSHTKDIDALFELQAEYVWKFIEPKLDQAIKDALRKAVG
jgi:DNA invertase Pin-like site-specific DNA recombinase